MFSSQTLHKMLFYTNYLHNMTILMPINGIIVLNKNNLFDKHTLQVQQFVFE